MSSSSSSGDKGEKQLFRGFIGGAAFQTKKGYKGNKMPTLWCKFIFESFENDDDELALIGLSSTIADINSQVNGGEYCSPFSIGGYGFYAKNQYEQQSNILKQNERVNAGHKNFLSIAEWDTVDTTLDKLANFGNYTFIRACCGDTFASLAIKKNAYTVAKVITDLGIDPMVENDDGYDLFGILQQQYGDLSDVLQRLQNDQDVAVDKLLLPGEIRELERRNNVLLSQYSNCVNFIQSFIVLLKNRLECIKDDKVKYKKMTLMKKEVPKDIAYNVSIEDRVILHIKECSELIDHINLKVVRHKRLCDERITLSDVLEAKNAEVEGRKPAKYIDPAIRAELEKKLFRMDANLSNADADANDAITSIVSEGMLGSDDDDSVVSDKKSQQKNDNDSDDDSDNDGGDKKDVKDDTLRVDYSGVTIKQTEYSTTYYK